MASISQNLPRTFYKLAEKWDKRVGARNFESKCWTSSSVDNREPIHKVAYLMSEKLGSLFHKLTDLSSECQWSSSQQIWIYDMRQSDTLPKSQTDSQRLYRFVEVLVKSWFDGEERGFLSQNIHIATCFFVWYFTKPSFFFKDNVMRQTTRKGIQRVWTPLLLGKKPTSQKESVTTPSTKSQFNTTTDILLPKQQEQQAKLQTDIQEMLSSTTLSQPIIEWEDSRRAHMKISECLGNSNSGLSIKQNKKLQKMYNEYSTLTAKINKTMNKKRKVERANAKIVTPSPQPSSPPKLIRKSACELDSEEDTPVKISVECRACESGQANQLAHMGGCLPDKLEITEDTDVPDCWEDL